ncbi:MAG TPA: hypothetical protein VFY85_08990 [Gemmatimonadaceae bacterium]|nr:hypothetical protein [Gemmatimonadaceae bacterium]
MNPRPEIVLPPGFALRIDYDPESSPASLLITAYRDDAPVGQAHVDPREVGQRLRLEVEPGGDGARDEPGARLRLTPQRAMRAIMMDAVTSSVPPHEPPPSAEAPSPHPAMAALHELAREGELVDECHYDTDNPRAMNALVWLKGGMAVVLPDDVMEEEARWARMQRVLRSFSVAAVDLLGIPLRNPLRLRDVDGLAES